MRGCFSIILFFFPFLALAWGHSPKADTSANLSFNAISQKRISYSISDSSGLYNEKSLQLQLRSAIRLWLDGLTDTRTIELKKLSCNKTVDLKLFVSPDTNASNHYGPGFYESKNIQGKANAVIHMNSVFMDNLTPHPVRDFLELFNKDVFNGENFLKSLIKEMHSHQSLSQKHNIPYDDLYANTYSFLIHEVGHAFGLCDTGFSSSCDAKFRSSHQPDSIMKSGEYFYLTDDDKEGISNMRKRVLYY